MRRPRRSQPTRVDHVVPQVLSDLGLEGAQTLLRILECWEAAVGPEVARHCRPSALRGNVLEATAESSVWCQQLQLRRAEILEALRRELGDGAPADLWLRVG